MYKLLLIFKYLRRKLAPMFAALAVTLCTAMVIIVLSVMGGFLDMLRTSAHQLSGDVIVTGGSYTGFPYYQDLLKRLDKKPAIAAATPVIHSFGLIHIEDQTIPVQVEGIRPRGLDRVVPYKSTLHWTGQDYLRSLTSAFPPADQQTAEDKKLLAAELQQARQMNLKQLAMNLNVPGDGAKMGEGRRAPIVLGIAVNPYAVRDVHGHYHFARSSVGRKAVLTVVPVAQSGMITDTSLHQMVVVNEFKSGLYEIDSNRVYIGFDLLQKMLNMNPAHKVDEETGEDLPQMTPGRVNEILIRAARGYSERQAVTQAQDAANAVMSAHPDVPALMAQTWRQRYRTILDAVENEMGLVTFLYAIISIVAVVMVATTFYMTVLDKTRDIGVLRALGASQLGVMNLFLGYGLAIGLVGAGIGMAIAWAIVTHLNGIQNVIADWTGWRMWNPQVYAFDHIPDQLLWGWAWAIAAGAVVASVLGALIPAVIAALLDPVEALRHE